MSQLTIYADNNPSNALVNTCDLSEITQQLAKVNVRFEQWQATAPINEHTTNPAAAQMREKFLFEHTHSEDEVRFFVKGQGLFCLHIDAKIYQVLCQQGDLISVPTLTPHWFDMGSDPEFTAIRLFNNTEGWVAKSTESEIAKQFPLLP